MDKNKKREYQEHDKILQTLDHQDHHDLASHLLLAAKYRVSQPPSKRTKRGRTVADDRMVITDPWTAWPLPASEVPRTVPIPSSSATETQTHLSSSLHAELETTIVRTARKRIQSEGEPSSVSANEHPPFHVTREISSHILSKLDRLLLTLGRVKYQQSTSERSKKRILKSRWDEVVALAGISGCVDSAETMKYITERCNKLFDEEMPWAAETV